MTFTLQGLHHLAAKLSELNANHRWEETMGVQPKGTVGPYPPRGASYVIVGGQICRYCSSVMTREKTTCTQCGAPLTDAIREGRFPAIRTTKSGY